MSASQTIVPQTPSIANLKTDQDLGKYGIWLVISTEGFLFVDLFFSYFYLANRTGRWNVEIPPKLGFALILLAILLASSVVLHLFGEKAVEKEKYGAARAGVAATLLLGLIFLALEGYSMYLSWSNLTPATDSYGSIFYTILCFHAAHVIVGSLMLIYVLFLPLGPSETTPHRPLHSATLYWHFVDAVWIFVVLFLFILPNL
ncbi:MAG TPA: cytochrome c oxidase subunit 3 [Bryobacteraceae bacterium]|nr:cytochrome c oxidase subunit 3 [Bryobacteraceae bacterium]